MRGLQGQPEVRRNRRAILDARGCDRTLQRGVRDPPLWHPTRRPGSGNSTHLTAGGNSNPKRSRALWNAGVHQARKGHDHPRSGLCGPDRSRTREGRTWPSRRPLGLYGWWGSRNRCPVGSSDRGCVVPYSTSRPYAHRCLSWSRSPMLSRECGGSRQEASGPALGGCVGKRLPRVFPAATAQQ